VVTLNDTNKQTHTHTHTHTHTNGRTPLDEGSACCDNTQHSNETDGHTPSEFEPAVPVNERSQTHDLDSAATATGKYNFSQFYGVRSSYLSELKIFSELKICQN